MWRVKLPFMTDPPGMRPQGVSDGFWPVFGERRPKIEQNRRVTLSFTHPTPVPAGTCVETGKPAGVRTLPHRTTCSGTESYLKTYIADRVSDHMGRIP